MPLARHCGCDPVPPHLLTGFGAGSPDLDSDSALAAAGMLTDGEVAGELRRSVLTLAYADRMCRVAYNDGRGDNRVEIYAGSGNSLVSLFAGPGGLCIGPSQSVEDSVRGLLAALPAVTGRAALEAEGDEGFAIDRDALLIGAGIQLLTGNGVSSGVSVLRSQLTELLSPERTEAGHPFALHLDIDAAIDRGLLADGDGELTVTQALVDQLRGVFSGAMIAVSSIAESDVSNAGLLDLVPGLINQLVLVAGQDGWIRLVIRGDVCELTKVGAVDLEILMNAAMSATVYPAAMPITSQPERDHHEVSIPNWLEHTEVFIDRFQLAGLAALAAQEYRAGDALFAPDRVLMLAEQREGDVNRLFVNQSGSRILMWMPYMGGVIASRGDVKSAEKAVEAFVRRIGGTECESDNREPFELSTDDSLADPSNWRNSPQALADCDVDDWIRFDAYAMNADDDGIVRGEEICGFAVRGNGFWLVEEDAMSGTATCIPIGSGELRNTLSIC